MFSVGSAKIRSEILVEKLKFSFPLLSRGLFGIEGYRDENRMIKIARNV